MTTWFIDTGFVIALSAPRDHFHEKARVLAAEIQQSGIQLVTTQAVIFEIGAALSKSEFREDAARLINSLYEDASIRIVASSEDLMQQAIRLFEQRSDKEWSLCDCMSFIVMKNLEITNALSTDHHFVQAGFTALFL
jgi:uncharacterized protein